MAGRPNSYYEYSVGGSAADAYNTPSPYADDGQSSAPPAHQHQHDQAQNQYNPYAATAPPAAVPTATYPDQRRSSYLQSPPMPPTAAPPPTHRDSASGSGMYDARPTHSNGYAMANGHDDEDDEDDEDEDWNVYDDFNMTRPLSNVPNRDSTNGLQSTQEGYWDASTPGLSAAESKASLMQTPYSDYPQRKSLLSSDAFGFDVRNADPRKSLPPTNGGIAVAGMASHAPHDSNANRLSMLSGTGPKHADSATGIELITVPALGTEYTKEEMRDMTRTTKKKKKRSARKKRVGLWVRGEDHLWGWLSPRVAVFMAFIFFALLAVTLFFVIPRVPSFGFLTTNPVSAVPDGSAMQIHHSPTNFSMTMDLNLRADNTAGWIPSKATDMKVVVSDRSSNKKVGEGSMNSFSFPGRKKTVFKFPVDFAYVSPNATGDQTFLDFYSACGPKIANTPRPSLTLVVVLTMKIQGLVGSKGTSTTLTDLECPFELQNFQ